MEKDNLSLHEICQDCGTRCCKEPGPPVVLPEELEKIRAYLKENNLKDHIMKSKDSYIIPRDKNKCAYLKEEGCEIQEVKPLECAVYPLSLDENLQVGIVCFSIKMYTVILFGLGKKRLR